MKKKTLIFMATVVLVLSGCMSGQSGLSGILGTVTNGETIGNVITSVLGLTKVTQRDILGTWKYYQPGCAFTSEQLLKKAGGEVVAAEIKTKVKPYYDKAGVSSSNTQITFSEDGKFSAIVAGKQFSGTYTYDEASAKISMKTLLFTVNCYAKKNAGSMGFLFEASKLLNVLQMLSALSGSSDLSAIGDLAKQYDGVRIGFDMK
ncbi:MAG: DUF4923 family protein [Prevotella sp.]|nr:DUF4923 family protein [Prevotella sp.]MBR6189718.1 DUF4923 family protein [Prevotella sp.]